MTGAIGRGQGVGDCPYGARHANSGPPGDKDDDAENTQEAAVGRELAESEDQTLRRQGRSAWARQSQGSPPPRLSSRSPPRY